MKLFVYTLLFTIVPFCKIRAAIPVNRLGRPDTIYYLIDTAKTPLKDRMLTVGNGFPHKFYTINCPCLNAGMSPQLRCNVTKKSALENSSLKKIESITLVNLIRLIKKNESDNFNDQFIIFFIEKEGDHYTKNRAWFLGSKITTVE